MKFVLAAIDRGPAARSVLLGATRLAAMFGCDARALWVDGDEPLQSAVAAGIEVLHRHGPPVEAILAELASTDVIAGVVGMRATPSGRRPAGHVTQEVIAAAQKVVMVVPPESLSDDVPFQRALLPLDGSEQAAAAVRDLVASLSAAGVALVAVHTFNAASTPPFLDRPGDLAAWGAEFLARHLPLAHTKLIWRAGSPVSGILTAATDEAADLIVLSWSQDLSVGHGATVRELLARSTIPMLLVPLASTAPGGLTSG